MASWLQSSLAFALLRFRAFALSRFRASGHFGSWAFEFPRGALAGAAPEERDVSRRRSSPLSAPASCPRGWLTVRRALGAPPLLRAASLPSFETDGLTFWHFPWTRPSSSSPPPLRSQEARSRRSSLSLFAAVRAAVHPAVGREPAFCGAVRLRGSGLRPGFGGPRGSPRAPRGPRGLLDSWGRALPNGRGTAGEPPGQRPRS